MLMRVLCVRMHVCLCSCVRKGVHKGVTKCTCIGYNLGLTNCFLNVVKSHLLLIRKPGFEAVPYVVLAPIIHVCESAPHVAFSIFI